MFHITVLCERRAKRGMTRVSAARFGVHFFAGNSIVNSPLHCRVLNGERKRLWKSLSARRNCLFTVARRACAITGSHLFPFVENILLPRRRYGVVAQVDRLPRRPVWEFTPFPLIRRLDAFCSKGQVADLKNLEKEI
jgi:hypothetical protein